MTELPENIRRCVARYDPVTTEDVTLYPILMSEYEDFLMARPALEYMQQRLEPRYISLPLLQAFYEIDLTNIQNGTQPTGLFFGVLLFLSLALRLAPGESAENKVKQFVPVFREDKINKLKCLKFIQNGEEKSLTPIQYQRMRQILAAQNGIQLEADDANPTLIDAERILAQKNAPNLDANTETYIAGVSALTGKDEKEIYKWPVAKFERTAAFYKRMWDYIICGIGETQGTKWKGGNPVPNPWFDKARDHTAALMSMADFTKGQSVTTQTGGMPPVNLPKL